MERENCIVLMEEMLRERRSRQRGVLSQCSLYVGQPSMLAFVRSHPGCSQKQMADEAGVTPASIAASFKRLEHVGLISRRNDTADTRCNRVYITALGEKELDYCQDALQTIDSEMTEGMSEKEIKEFERLLRIMMENLKKKNN